MTGDPTADDEAMAGYSAALVDAVDAVVEAWVVRSVVGILTAWHEGAAVEPAVLARAHEAGAQAREAVVTDLRRLLSLDIDDQPTNPLSVLRGAVRYPTEVLRGEGVPPVARDDFAVRAFPDDDYGLVPAAFADVDPSLHEPGIEWGAAKAHIHLSRRRKGADR